MKVQDKIEMLECAALAPYARNSRTHSPEQIAQIARSIQEFGFTNPVLVDAQGGIVAGHGRVLAAQSIGVVSVPCLRVDWLTDAQKRAYVIADNQIALQSGWDDDVLASELSALLADQYDTSLLGFDIDTEDLIAELMEPSRFEKSQPNNFHEPDEEEGESANLNKYPLTVIMDEKEFAEWDAMKEKTGHSDKRLLLELLRGKK